MPVICQLRTTWHGQTDQTQESDSGEQTHTLGDQETDLPSYLNSLELIRPNSRIQSKLNSIPRILLSGLNIKNVRIFPLMSPTPGDSQKYGCSMASLAVSLCWWSYRRSLSRRSRASGLTRCLFSLWIKFSQRFRECLRRKGSISILRFNSIRIFTQ